MHTDLKMRTLQPVMYLVSPPSIYTSRTIMLSMGIPMQGPTVFGNTQNLQPNQHRAQSLWKVLAFGIAEGRRS